MKGKVFAKMRLSKKHTDVADYRPASLSFIPDNLNYRIIFCVNILGYLFQFSIKFALFEAVNQQV